MSRCRCLEHGGLTQSAEVIFNTIAEIGSMKLDDRGVVVRTYDCTATQRFESQGQPHERRIRLRRGNTSRRSQV